MLGKGAYLRSQMKDNVYRRLLDSTRKIVPVSLTRNSNCTQILHKSQNINHPFLNKNVYPTSFLCWLSIAYYLSIVHVMQVQIIITHSMIKHRIFT